MAEVAIFFMALVGENSSRAAARGAGGFPAWQSVRLRFRSQIDFVTPHKQIHMHCGKVADPDPSFRLSGDMKTPGE